MIINYPTGFYNGVIPHGPNIPGNVTYTISDSIPPRSNLVYPKIPIGVVVKQRAVVVLSEVQRRSVVGDLIFSVSSSSRSVLGNSGDQYDIGDVLDFTNTNTNTNANTNSSVSPMLVNNITEIQHNLSYFDYNSVGLSESDVKFIASVSGGAQSSLVSQLNILKQQRVDAELVIATQQKIINETNKTLAALVSVQAQVNSGDIATLIAKLNVSLASATAILNQAISDANMISSSASLVLSQLRAVSVVVK